MTINRKNLESTDGLWLAFKYFDIENRGYITKANFRDALERAGWKLKEDEIDKMLAENGYEKMEQFYFEQFSKIFQGKI